MKITPDCFLYEGEVDITANYALNVTPKGRLSIRKKDGSYEVYVHWYNTGEDEVLFTSNCLGEIVAFSNREGNADDIVGDDDE